jgi:hypothetical protein
MKVAILDDYQNVALSMADWSGVRERAEITVFTDHVVDADAVVERLRPFDVVCVMRERTPLSRAIIETCHDVDAPSREGLHRLRSCAELKRSDRGTTTNMGYPHPVPDWRVE